MLSVLIISLHGSTLYIYRTESTVYFSIISQVRDCSQPKWRPPISCVQVVISPDILGPIRTPGQLILFDTHVKIVVHRPYSSPSAFELHSFRVKTLPNLPTLIIFGAGTTKTEDVFLFLSSPTSRDNIMTTMNLLGFEIVDEFDRVVKQPQLTFSRSMPTMSTIFEN